MNSIQWELLYNHLVLIYFTNLLPLIGSIIALFFLLKEPNKTPIVKGFIFYCSLGFILILLELFIAIFINDIKASKRILESFNIFLLLIELCIFYWYYNVFFRKKTLSTIINIILVSIVLFSTYYIIALWIDEVKLPEYLRVGYFLSSIDFFFLFLLVVVYYGNLIYSGSSYNLLKQPSFWITNGLLFYTVGVIPFFLLKSIISIDKETQRIFFGLHYITFGVLFLSIAKAASCKKSITT